MRQSIGLTMEDFGKKFTPNAHKSLVSKWEKGQSQPSVERLKKIAEIGDVSVDYLISGNKITYNNFIKKIKNNDEYLKEELSEKLLNFIESLFQDYEEIKNEQSQIINLFLAFQEELDISISELIPRFTELIYDQELDFYIEGSYILYTEDIYKITTKIYLIDYIYELLVQISLDYPSIYYRNLIEILGSAKDEIINVSFKKNNYTDTQQTSFKPKFIREAVYNDYTTDINKIIEKIRKYNLHQNK
ncbi:helix-turn-helix domain-containing protein [Staphylococcus sp. OJ82]|uniref:helix-turn-helix domain-containing protein n=1 Tax=Staphylococcus sp. OJ82 TaxID=1202667 RepID=UPI002378BD3F|nr:helix-turn-helix transcriptional regulator [Staphylococcus sp. OJ82]